MPKRRVKSKPTQDPPASTSSNLVTNRTDANFSESDSPLNGGLQIFGNVKDAKIPKKATRRSHESPSPTSRKRTRSTDGSHNSALLQAFVHDNCKRRRSGNDTIDALVIGDTPFTDNGDLAEAMAALAKAKKEDWTKLSIRQALDWCHTLHSVLIQQNLIEAGQNASSLAAIAQHMTLLAAECPTIETMAQNALRDSLKIASRDGQTLQGSPTLGIPIIKHLCIQVGHLTAELETLKKNTANPALPAYNNSKMRRPNSYLTSTKEQRTDQFCRNCFEGTMKKVHHSAKDCENIGNQCFLLCTYCADGNKHWYSQCPVLRKKGQTNC